MISIIIPTRDKKDNIRFVLGALVEQTFKEFEVIVVDNGDDSTYEEIKHLIYGLDITYINYIPKESWNASVPRNKGAKLAKYDYLLFLDSDVILNARALEYYAQDIKANPDRVIIGPYDWLPPLTVENKKQCKIEDYPGLIPDKQALDCIGKDIRQPSFEKATTPDLTFKTVFDGLACFGGNLLIPKKIFWKSGGYDENMRYGVEDGDLGITLWEMGVDFSYDTRCIGYHQWHPRSPIRSREAPAEVRKLDEKHHMDIVYKTNEAYRRWGIDWQPSSEYFDTMQEYEEFKKQNNKI